MSEQDNDPDDLPLADLSKFGQPNSKLGEALDERTGKRILALNETLRVLRVEARNALIQTGSEPSEEYLNEILRDSVTALLPNMVANRILEVWAPEVLGLGDPSESEDPEDWDESDEED